MDGSLSLSFSISPTRLMVACLAVSAVWMLAPQLAHAAVAFGEIGQNVAENAKGVAKGITMGGFAAGAGMGVWGCVDMYKLPYSPNSTEFAYNIL